MTTTQVVNRFMTGLSTTYLAMKGFSVAIKRLGKEQPPLAYIYSVSNFQLGEAQNELSRVIVRACMTPLPPSQALGHGPPLPPSQALGHGPPPPLPRL